MLIAEAIDALVNLGWWLLGWILVLGAAAAVVLLAGSAVGAWAVRGIWRTTVRPAWARGCRASRRIAHRTRKHDYREAA
ncbi:hypothetical protein [Streptomyces sp. YKOK-I1]